MVSAVINSGPLTAKISFRLNILNGKNLIKYQGIPQSVLNEQ
jgi:hypothetical protein